MAESSYYCASSHALVVLGQMCINGSDISIEHCHFPLSNVSKAFRYGFGYTVYLIAVIGIMGNLTTLICIPYAVTKKMFRLNRNLNTTTIYIIYLSALELLWCLVVGFPCGYQSLVEIWPFGVASCKAYALLDQILPLADHAALALISISRCLDLTSKSAWGSFSEKTSNLIFILVLSWLPSMPFILLYIIPSVELDAGWNCAAMKCTLLPANPDTYQNGLNVINGLLWYEAALSVLFIGTICISYIIIWRWARNETMYLKQSANNISHIRTREIKMTRTILSLIVFHGICSVPFLFYNELYLSSNNIITKNDATGAIYYVLQALYNSQFCLNFVIYAGSNEQYRKAYIGCMKCFFCSKHQMASKESELNILKGGNTSVSSRWSQLMRQISGNQNKMFELMS